MIYVFDIEVFQHDWLIVLKNMGTRTLEKNCSTNICTSIQNLMQEGGKAIA